MNTSGHGTKRHSGLGYKDQIRLKYISKYRKLRLIFNSTFSILTVSAVAVRWQVYLDHPAITIAATAPLVLLMLIAAFRITLYRCPYCRARLGWTPFFRNRCKCCNDLVGLSW